MKKRTEQRLAKRTKKKAQTGRNVIAGQSMQS